MGLNFIDIASHQAGMDLATMFAENPSLDGVIIKAGSGTGYTNPYFKGWADWLHDNGKMLGAYHYCRETTTRPGTAKAEAEHFYSLVKPYIGSIVTAADFERDNSDALVQGTGWLKDFLDAFYQLSGVKPLVYCSQSITQSYNFKEIAAAGYKLWMAQYANNKTVYGFQDNPWQSGSVAPFAGYAIHQYTSQGYLNGFNRNLDFDKFYGSKEDWFALAGGASPSPAPAPDPTPSLKPADPEVVAAVLSGAYGNGNERITALRNAGYDPQSVQSKINTLYSIAVKCRQICADNMEYLEQIKNIIKEVT